MRLRRRAQVRGIDFTAALLVFMLVMSQILIMTSNLIQINYHANVASETASDVINVGTGILSISGSPQNWATTPTASLPASWQFGMKDQSGSEVDPNVLSRLADTTNSSFRITYSDLSNGLNSTLGGKPFRLVVNYTHTVSITSITPSGSNLQVRGQVSDNNLALNGSEVWVFGVNSAGVVSSSTTSLSNGTYIATLTYGALPSYAQVVVISKYGYSSQSMTDQVYINSVTPTTANITLQDRTSTTSLHQVDLHVSGTDTNYDYYALFIPVSGSSVSSTSDVASGGTSGTLPIPDLGLVVTVVVGQGTNEVGVSAFPIASNVGPAANPNSSSDSFTSIVSCRGILVEVILTVWRY